MNCCEPPSERLTTVGEIAVAVVEVRLIVAVAEPLGPDAVTDTVLLEGIVDGAV